MSCRASRPQAPKVDDNDVRLLSRSRGECSLTVRSRITAVSGTAQRELAQAIRRARFLALRGPGWSMTEQATGGVLAVAMPPRAAGGRAMGAQEMAEVGMDGRTTAIAGWMLETVRSVEA